jgi:hypothetical protein
MNLQTDQFNLVSISSHELGTQQFKTHVSENNGHSPYDHLADFLDHKF